MQLDVTCPRTCCAAAAGRRRELLQRAVLFHVLLTSYEFAVAEADDLRKPVRGGWVCCDGPPTLPGAPTGLTVAPGPEL